MKKLTAATGAIALGLALVGCSSEAKTEPTTSTSTSMSTTTSAQASGLKPTIGDYAKENGITVTPMHHGDPGPVVDLPVPDGWSQLPESEDAPYGGITFDAAANPENPPMVVAKFAKFTGNVDPDKIFELAPNSMTNLAGFESMVEAHKDTLGGYEALEFGGSYSPEGALTNVAQKTVVIPGQDGIYVLQLNAQALDPETGTLLDALSAIDEKTTITA
jgi:Probable lipoprotein LpqN